MEIIIWSIVLLISLVVLVKASDYFTDAAEKIGLFLGLPKFIIGVTIVAIGTSLPELISSIISVLENTTEFVSATVVGSNIVNIFLILGISSIVKSKITTTYNLVHIDLPLFISSAAYLAMASWDGVFTGGEGILAIAALIIYFAYAIGTKKKSETLRKAINKDLKDEAEAAKIMEKEDSPLGYITVLILILSLIFVFVSAKFTVDSVIELAKIFHVGTELITITVVAIGTSLPELSVSLSSTRNGKAEMVIGNIIGSNIFNSLGVMGISSLIAPLIVPQSIIMFSIPVMILAAVLYFFKIQDKEITKWEGWILVIFYLFFIGKTINVI